MRVAVVSQWFPPEKAAIPSDIAAALVGRGHEVTVVTGFPNYPGGKVYPGWSQRPRRRTTQDGYSLVRVSLYPSHDRSAVRRAAGYASFALSSSVLALPALAAADVIYVYHPPLTSALGPWLAHRTRGVPYVLHVQDLWPDSVLSSGMVSSRLARTAGDALERACDRAHRDAAAVVCIAPTMACLLRDRGVPEDRLRVVPNWADESVFGVLDTSAQGATPSELRGVFSVMFAGNLGHIQGLETAVLAAAAVRDLRDFRLVLVGDGVAAEGLRRLARSAGADNVVFLGSRSLDEMPRLTAAADVQLVSLQDLPFLRGTIPSKIAAVLASGLPVVAAVAGDASDLVDEAGAGWTCVPGDVAALEAAFRAAHASTADERGEQGAAGRVYYERHLARAVGLRSIVGVIEAVGQGRSAV